MENLNINEEMLWGYLNFEDSSNPSISMDDIYEKLLDRGFIPEGRLNHRKGNYKMEISEDIVERIYNNIKRQLREIYEQRKNLEWSGNGVKKPFLSEGLICSYDPYKVFNILKRRGFKVGGGIWKQSPKKENKNHIILQVKFDGDITREKVDYVLKIMETCGWFFRSIEYNGKHYKEIDKETIEFFKDKVAILFFEPKFDVVADVNELPNHFYHITKVKYLPKILKQGLKPTAKNKVTNTTEAVYLLAEKPTNWIDTANRYRDIEGNKEKYCLLLIEKEKVKDNNLFYYDLHSEQISIYTHNTIAPYAIKVVEIEN